jgi:hypothetical protein
LIQNCVGWLTRGTAARHVEGDGVIECFAWETEPGFALHLINYTNPNMHRGWLRRHYPIGEQKVRMALPADRRVVRVELLRPEKVIAFRRRGAWSSSRCPE